MIFPLPSLSPSASIWQAVSSAKKLFASSSSNLWQHLTRAIDLVQWKPAPAENVLARELRDRAGAYIILKNAHTRTYLRLAPREYWLWQRLDGKTTVQELVVAYFMQFQTFAFGLVVGLARQLYQKQMLRDEPRYVFAALDRGLKSQSAGRLAQTLRALLSKQWMLQGLDAALTLLHRAIGWIIFSRAALAIYFFVSVTGLVIYFRLVGEANLQLISITSPVSLLMLWLLTALPIIIHELGHALMTKQYGREVHRGGVMLSLGIPTVFVDTTDIWLEPKRARIAVAFAGPATGFILAGACALLIWFFPLSPLAPLLFQLATLSLVISILNLNPALNLDGYHLLTDLVELPRLNERAFAFLRHSFLPKLFKRERFTRDEIIFVFFGALVGLWTLYVAWVTLIFYRARGLASAQTFFANLDSNGLLAIRLALVIGLVAALIVARAQIGKLLAPLLQMIQRWQLVSGRRRAAISLLLAAALIAILPALLAPEIADTLEFILGTGVIGASAYWAWIAARAMTGSRFARAWQFLALALAFLSAANLFWWLPFPLTDRFAFAFDAASALTIGVALASGWQLIAGLRGSWRAVSVWFFGAGWLGIFIALLGYAFLPAVGARFVIGLFFLSGIVHWFASDLRAAPREQIAATEQTARVALFGAFKGLADNTLTQLAFAYGRGARARVEAGFDQIARAKGWEIQMRQRGARPFTAESSYLRLPAADLGEIFAASLNALFDESARLGGKKFAQRALARSYDALDWEVREVALEYILPQVAWASALSAEWRQTRGDVRTLLQRAPLFAEFSPAEIQKIAARVRVENFARGQVIIQQGDAGDKFYLLRRGRAEVLRRDAEGLESKTDELVSGDYFGERALLTGEPRNATIRAATPVEAVSLSKKDFDRLVRSGFEGDRKVDAAVRRLNLLWRIPIFADFSAFELRHLATQLERVRLPVDHPVVQQGDHGDEFYIIETGQVAVRVQLPNGETVETALLGPGEYFGEIALLMNVPRTATVLTTQPTQLLTINAENFRRVVWQSQGVNRALERAASRRFYQYTQTLTRAVGESAHL